MIDCPAAQRKHDLAEEYLAKTTVTQGLFLFLDKFPEVISRLKGVLERFANALSCIDQCFIADDLLEQLPTASQVGKTTVGGIDLNKRRMRAVVEAVIASSA